MTRTEWVNRCAKRWQRITGASWQESLMTAGKLAEAQDLAHGPSGIAWESPEDVADEADAENRLYGEEE